jgi:hypothetical protein
MNSSVASGFSRKDGCGARRLSKFSGGDILPAKAGSHTVKRYECIQEK